MEEKDSLFKRQTEARRLIFDMIDASMRLASRKGKHRLEKGCSCIACVNKRKTILRGPVSKWKFRL